MSPDDKPGATINQCSPEWKSKCMDWALQWHSRSLSKLNATDIVSAAKLFYEYVYENK